MFNIVQLLKFQQKIKYILKTLQQLFTVLITNNYFH